MTDEFAPAYSTIAIATKTRDRYWDGDAVRTEHTVPNAGPYRGRLASAVPGGDSRPVESGVRGELNPAGAPLLDWWDVPAEKVAERLTLAMCPRRVCRVCGEPSRRIVDIEQVWHREPRVGRAQYPDGPMRDYEGRAARSVTTLGWSDCGHDTWRAGVVYDPFQRNETDVSTRFLIGDVFAGLATIPDNSVDLIVSSPPFLALRSYLPADHPDKGLEIGSEATPGEFLDRLLDVVEACARVLAPHGSLVFELGDTYAGTGDSGFERNKPGYGGQARAIAGAAGLLHGTQNRKTEGWPLDKSKVLVPQLFAIALAYGRNPLTGRQTEPWRVRNTVAWCRPNPPVGRDGDKFRPATSSLTVATKARDRYWDGDAVRTEYGERSAKNAGYPTSYHFHDGGYDERERTVAINPAGAPLLDYWVIPTEPYSGSHYATFPRALVVPLVKSMAPQKVCRVCGEPSRRITERTPEYAAAREAIGDFNQRANGQAHSGSRSVLSAAAGKDITAAENVTIGWSDCGCECGVCSRYSRPYPEALCEHHWRAGLVLDPFAGSGTTLQVASGHGLDSIGIDIDARNAELARERVGGLFLEVETLGARGSGVTYTDRYLKRNHLR